jgi:hypothetical protein
MNQQNHQQNQTPQQTEQVVKWPFPIVNNQRTEESQALLDKKSFSKTKDDLSDMEEALF